MTRPPLDRRYVEARRVLLDCLEALSPHAEAVIVAGAQAVYVHVGDRDLGIAPYTTDGDIALDPSKLGPRPGLEGVMEGSGFDLRVPGPGRVEPGVWEATVEIDGEDVKVPVDLIIPAAVAPGGASRRSVPLPGHERNATRRIRGLEAALVDHAPHQIAALDPADARIITSQVAGPAALFVAKAHKLGDRLSEGKARRIDEKDAADVFMLMQATDPGAIGTRLRELSGHAMAGPTARRGHELLTQLFGGRGDGVAMAARSLRLALPEARVRQLCAAYIGAVQGR